MLVGAVLRHNQSDIWKRIYQLAGGNLADFVVVASASPRPRLYGGFAVRGLQRYGGFVDLLPLATQLDQFDIDYREAVVDAEIIDKTRRSNAVFFVGGAPQRLASVLFNADGSNTPLASAIQEMHARGGVIIGGIPAMAGVATNTNPMTALEQGRIAEKDLFPGLNLLANDWYLDQHFFSGGRFAQSIIAMRQLNKTFGLGIGVNTAAAIDAEQLEVIGEQGVVLIDLSLATSATGINGFTLKGARLSYLDHGDRLDMVSRQITPHTYKLEEFVIEPGANGFRQPDEEQYTVGNMFSPGSLLDLMITSIEGKHKQVAGLAMKESRGNQESGGYLFKFYTGPDSIGWLTTLFGGQRWTILNIYLDIVPLEK